MVNKKSLKQRAIYVYPTTEMSKRWKELAGEAGVSISRFVIEHVENSLRFDEPDFKSRVDLVNESRQLLETIRDKDRRIEHQDRLIEILQRDLRMQSDRMFTVPAFSGIRSYDKKLINILKEPGVHSNESILVRLGIGPRDVDSVRAVSAQLDNLVQYGLVNPTPKGYTWVE